MYKIHEILFKIIKDNDINKIVLTSKSKHLLSNVNFKSIQLYDVLDARSAGYLACGISEQTHEKVVIIVTNGDELRNLSSAMTEAHYSKLPILVVYFREFDVNYKYDNYIQINDTYLYYKSCASEDDNLIQKFNEAFIKLSYNGGGPTLLELNDSQKEIDIQEKDIVSTKIYTIKDKFPQISNIKKIALYIGYHKDYDDDTKKMLNTFSNKYKVDILVDQFSNFNNEKNIPFNRIDKNICYDLVIAVGNIFHDINVKANKVFRISQNIECGCYNYNYSYIFNMKEIEFYQKAIESGFCDCVNTNQSCNCKKLITNNNNRLRDALEEIFKNIDKQCIMYTSESLKEAIKPTTINSNIRYRFSNAGALSSTIGASLANAKKLYLCMMEYEEVCKEINTFGIRDVGKNIVVFVINTNKQKNLLKEFVTDLGYSYIKITSLSSIQDINIQGGQVYEIVIGDFAND